MLSSLVRQLPYDEFYRSNHLVLKPEFEAATTDQILPMVKNNFGLGFFPEKMASQALASGEVYQIHLQETIPYRELFLVENKERSLPIAAEALKEILIQYSGYSLLPG